MELVPGLSTIILTQGQNIPSWCLMHCSVKMDANAEDSGRLLVGHVTSPFDFFPEFFLIDGGLLLYVPYQDLLS